MGKHQATDTCEYVKGYPTEVMYWKEKGGEQLPNECRGQEAWVVPLDIGDLNPDASPLDLQLTAPGSIFKNRRGTFNLQNLLSNEWHIVSANNREQIQTANDGITLCNDPGDDTMLVLCGFPFDPDSYGGGPGSDDYRQFAEYNAPLRIPTRTEIPPPPLYETRTTVSPLRVAISYGNLINYNFGVCSTDCPERAVMLNPAGGGSGTVDMGTISCADFTEGDPANCADPGLTPCYEAASANSMSVSFNWASNTTTWETIEFDNETQRNTIVTNINYSATITSRTMSYTWSDGLSWTATNPPTPLENNYFHGSETCTYVIFGAALSGGGGIAFTPYLTVSVEDFNDAIVTDPETGEQTVAGFPLAPSGDYTHPDAGTP